MGSRTFLVDDKLLACQGAVKRPPKALWSLTPQLEPGSLFPFPIGCANYLGWRRGGQYKSGSVRVIYDFRDDFMPLSLLTLLAKAD